ncbi:sulfurtransferase-like selenium metabolism protein YedF [Salmonella enterica]|nr:sulfurtransferase-like selenium metabolism protein YedF [Salmonella enterica]
MSVSRAQLSLRVNRSADWQNGRCNRRDEEADDELLSRILGIISDMPGYGYRRVWAIMRKQLRNEGLPPVNAKRVYRVMSENNLLLLHDKPQRPKREHNGKIAVAESNQRWCSDSFGCVDGEKLRVTFALTTSEALPQLKKGEILEVVSDCLQSINNIPVDARNHGYTVLDIQQDRPTIRYLIQK